MFDIVLYGIAIYGALVFAKAINEEIDSFSTKPTVQALSVAGYAVASIPASSSTHTSSAAKRIVRTCRRKTFKLGQKKPVPVPTKPVLDLTGFRFHVLKKKKHVEVTALTHPLLQQLDLRVYQVRYLPCYRLSDLKEHFELEGEGTVT